MTVKIALFAPMPIPSVPTVMMVNSGKRISRLRTCSRPIRNDTRKLARSFDDVVVGLDLAGLERADFAGNRVEQRGRAQAGVVYGRRVAESHIEKRADERAAVVHRQRRHAREESLPRVRLEEILLDVRR